MANVNFRHCEISDLPKIMEIYNQAIRKGGITADLDEIDLKERTIWFNQHKNDPMHPIFVATLNNKILGYGYLSIYRPRRGLTDVAEISYYFDERVTGKGYGSKMMDYLLQYAKNSKLRILMALIHTNNQATVHLLKKFNFNLWGTLPKLDHDDFGKYYDQAIYGLDLEPV